MTKIFELSLRASTHSTTIWTLTLKSIGITLNTLQNPPTMTTKGTCIYCQQQILCVILRQPKITSSSLYLLHTFQFCDTQP